MLSKNPPQLFQAGRQPGLQQCSRCRCHRKDMKPHPKPSLCLVALPYSFSSSLSCLPSFSLSHSEGRRTMQKEEDKGVRERQKKRRENPRRRRTRAIRKERQNQREKVRGKDTQTARDRKGKKGGDAESSRKCLAPPRLFINCSCSISYGPPPPHPASCASSSVLWPHRCSSPHQFCSTSSSAGVGGRLPLLHRRLLVGVHGRPPPLRLFFSPWRVFLCSTVSAALDFRHFLAASFFAATSTGHFTARRLFSSALPQPWPWPCGELSLPPPVPPPPRIGTADHVAAPCHGG